MGKNSATRKLNSQLILVLGYLYLAIPMLIFTVFWMKAVYSVLLALIILYSLWNISKDTGRDYRREDYIVMDKKAVTVMVAALIVIVLWVCMSGVGKLMFQNSDHMTRNAIFEVLVNRDWPAIGRSDEDIPDNVYGLVYYIGFWLVPALFGKVFGIGAGFVFQAVWAVIGISILFLLFCIFRKKIVLWPLLVFIFFGGLDIIGFFLAGHTGDEFTWYYHLDKWMQVQSEDEISSFTTQLFWVFNQALPAWILMMLLFMQKRNKYIAFIVGISLISTVLPIVGMFPYIIYVMYRNIRDIKAKEGKYKLSDIFSVENILGGGVPGIINLIYMLGNTWGEKFNQIIRGLNIQKIALLIVAIGAVVAIVVLIVLIYGKFISGTKASAILPYALFVIGFIGAFIIFVFGDMFGIHIKTAELLGNNRLYRIYMYGVFYILEVGLYLICIFWNSRKNPLFYIAALWIFVCPMIRIGKFSDFGMRATIPSLLVIYYLLISSFERYYKDRKRILCIALAVIFLIGCPTALFEMNRSVYKTGKRLNKGKPVYAETYEETKVFSSKNFRGKLDQSFFYKYIAKEQEIRE
ncbi:MAG: hypothetical protein K6B41_15505 [Butyrivibrio sp.]|nr:hypothetical protein [Butyrivibrio sp.]